MLSVQTLDRAEQDTMSISRMRQIVHATLTEMLVREIRRSDGEKVPVTAKELSSTVVVERGENGRAVGVKPNYELAYREVRFSQGGILQLTPRQFEAFIAYNIATAVKSLVDFQPSLEWQLVAALVDPVQVSRPAAPVSGSEPSPEEASIRLAQAVGRMAPSTRQEEPPTRVSSLVGEPFNQNDWRWYVRMTFVSDGSDWSDPNERNGGSSPGLARYAETRQLRHLPRGTKKNREQAIQLMERLEASSALVVAPASRLTPEQRATAIALWKDGANLVYIAQLLGMTAADLEAEMPVAPAKRARTTRPSQTPSQTPVVPDDGA